MDDPLFPVTTHPYRTEILRLERKIAAEEIFLAGLIKKRRALRDSLSHQINARTETLKALRAERRMLQEKTS